MVNLYLFILVFVLGMRHGLDADHLAYIDGQVRYNWKIGSSLSRWVGSFFSLGHGSVVMFVAIIISFVSEKFTFPPYFDEIGTWVSIVSLFLVGTVNVTNLLRKNEDHEHYVVKGIKGNLVPSFIKSTNNPFIIALVGGLFALAADTVSQTSVWALASIHAGKYMSILLGLVFLAGMMITDTIDSWLTHKMITHSNKLGRKASKIMGWLIVLLSYGVSFYELFAFFNHSLDIDFEIIGVISFIIIVTIFIFMSWNLNKRKK